MEILHINSKVACVTADKDFKGTEEEVKKIATASGQFDNVKSYRVEGDKVIFAFDEDANCAPCVEGSSESIEAKIKMAFGEEESSVPSVDMDELVKAAFDYFNISEGVMAVFRSAISFEHKVEGVKNVYINAGLDERIANEVDWSALTQRISDIYAETNPKTNFED